MKVLIADDSAMGRLLLRSALEALGHECLATSSGGEAWDAFRREGADVVISDWSMPGLEGPELCRRVRAQARPHYTYFILLSTLEDRRLALEGMDAGADDYLVKPLDYDELRLRLVAAQRITGLHKELAERDARLRALAETDALTGLPNRHRSTEILEHFLDLARRQRQVLAVALLDVDYFKQVNDTHGHLVGDLVLRELGSLLRKSFRGHDVVGRWGGEEFAAGMFGMARADARRRLETLLEQFGQRTFESEGGRSFRVTFSAGLALFPEDATDLAGLYGAADAALYRAKRGGRARVEAAPAPADLPRAA